MGASISFTNFLVSFWDDYRAPGTNAIRPRGYKTFFMLNSVEHEILSAHKYKKYQDIRLFLGSVKPRMLFFPDIHSKIPTIVAILIFMSGKNFMLS